MLRLQPRQLQSLALKLEVSHACRVSAKHVETADYCTILLNLATKSDIQAACIQADAMLRGAQEQADAALRAAHEQAAATIRAGWLTLAAGVFAGVAAYLSIARIAKHDARLTQSYRNHLASQVSVVETEVKTAHLIFKDDPVGYAVAFRDKPCLPDTTPFLQRISPDRWQDLSHLAEMSADIENVEADLRALLFVWGAVFIMSTGTTGPEGEGMQLMITLIDRATAKALQSLAALRERLALKPLTWWQRVFSSFRT